MSTKRCTDHRMSLRMLAVVPTSSLENKCSSIYLTYNHVQYICGKHEPRISFRGMPTLHTHSTVPLQPWLSTQSSHCQGLHLLHHHPQTHSLLRGRRHAAQRPSARSHAPPRPRFLVRLNPRTPGTSGSGMTGWLLHTGMLHQSSLPQVAGHP